ncbi:hypothetical protein C3B54_111312 [Pontimonas salivibrio]|uniref:Uncharacterized protein n=2 Tax=Pontimonas salivibrio TaxID=1159327 RepID=A0A2L2BRH5_9MICO|nr:hypothetical protein C3B54_111312 [Pontimonas salivibrio]
MARLVRQSMNNSEALNDAVEQSLREVFPPDVLRLKGSELGEIVRDAFEYRKSLVSPDGTLHDSFEESLDEEIRQRVEALVVAKDEPFDPDLFLHPITRAIQSVERRTGGPRLYAGLLLQLDSAFEVLTGDLMVAISLLHPVDYDLKSLGLSSGEIIRAVNQEGVAQLFAEREAATVLNRSLDAWIEWFERAPRKLIAPGALTSITDVKRFHLIRNVLAHGDAKPQSRHLKLMEELGLQETDFRLTSERFAEACEAYLALGYELWAISGDKLFSKEPGFSGPLTYIQIRLLNNGFSSVVASLDHSRLRSFQVDEVRINAWLAKLDEVDRDSEFELDPPFEENTVEEQIRQWEPDDSVAERFERLQLAKLVLTGDRVQANALATQMFASGRLQINHVLDWPIFRKLDTERILQAHEDGA